jgi:hypothetical protein
MNEKEFRRSLSAGAFPHREFAGPNGARYLSGRKESA